MKKTSGTAKIRTSHKIPKMNELSWLIGTVLCALGVALSTKAGLGLSMVAAPPYILHVLLSRLLPWFSQGMAEYVWQAIMLGVMSIIVRRFRFKYLLAFATAVFYGLVMDGFFFLLGGNAVLESMVWRIIFFVLGELLISLSIAFVFRTYLVPQAAECVVMEIADRYKLKVNSVKLGFDVTSLVISVIFAIVAFFTTGSFVGVGIGTVILTLINSPIIRLWGKLIDKLFTFEAAFPKLEGKFKN